MSKPIAQHADGTNCYTKGCKRGSHTAISPSVPTNVASQIKEQIETLKNKQPVAPSFATLKQEIAEALEHNITGTWGGIRQDNPNAISVWSNSFIATQDKLDKELHKPEVAAYVKQQLEVSRKELLDTEKAMETLTAFNHQKDFHRMKAASVVAFYQRADMVADDIANPSKDKYKMLFSDSENVNASETFATFDEAMQAHWDHSRLSYAYAENIDTEIRRKDVDGKEKTIAEGWGEDAEIAFIVESPSFYKKVGSVYHTSPMFRA